MCARHCDGSWRHANFIEKNTVLVSEFKSELDFLLGLQQDAKSKHTSVFKFSILYCILD